MASAEHHKPKSQEELAAERAELVGTLPGAEFALKTFKSGGAELRAYDIAMVPLDLTRTLDLFEAPGALVYRFFEIIGVVYPGMTNFWREGSWACVNIRPTEGRENYAHFMHGTRVESETGQYAMWTEIATDHGVFKAMLKKPKPFEGRHWYHADLWWISKHPAYEGSINEQAHMELFVTALSMLARTPGETHVIYKDLPWKDDDGWHIAP